MGIPGRPAAEMRPGRAEVATAEPPARQVSPAARAPNQPGRRLSAATPLPMAADRPRAVAIAAAAAVATRRGRAAATALAGAAGDPGPEAVAPTESLAALEVANWAPAPTDPAVRERCRSWRRRSRPCGRARLRAVAQVVSSSGPRRRREGSAPEAAHRRGPRTGGEPATGRPRSPGGCTRRTCMRAPPTDGSHPELVHLARAQGGGACGKDRSGAPHDDHLYTRLTLSQAHAFPGADEAHGIPSLACTGEARSMPMAP